jgi:hypothetical protein
MWLPTHCPAGHYSPIVKQLRGKAKPDGMVLVVGGCAEYITGEGGIMELCWGLGSLTMQQGLTL